VLTPLGTQSKGHQGWFSLGSFQLQPSEFAKVIVVITIAAVASQFHGNIDLRRLGVLLLLAGVPMGLVLLQGDLGTTLVFAVVVPAMLLVAGARSQHLAVLVVIGVIGAGLIVGGGMLKSYQQDRLTSFLKQDTKSADVQGASYNLDQSKTAIGSGGAWGKGLFKGTQTRLGIVPEQQTDFIFSAVGEQLGFVGAGTLIGLFGIIVWRMWRTSQMARDEFGTLLCIGLLAMLLFHVFENVGMTMGIMPITGIPLPFLSYGGSSTVANFAAIGLVLNVHMRRFS
jgi:rod shape determining protein RodA